MPPRCPKWHAAQDRPRHRTPRSCERQGKRCAHFSLLTAMTATRRDQTLGGGRGSAGTPAACQTAQERTDAHDRSVVCEVTPGLLHCSSGTADVTVGWADLAEKPCSVQILVILDGEMNADLIFARDSLLVGAATGSAWGISSSGRGSRKVSPDHRAFASGEMAPSRPSGFHACQSWRSSLPPMTSSPCPRARPS